MCHEAFPNVEMCQIANSPEVELDPMNLCLCPNCASEYKKMRADEYDLEYFLEDIENLSDAEIGSMDPVEVAFGNETIWFTQTHIAEIRELRALQEAVDKYKDSAGSGQKKPVDKPVQEDDDPEAEVVVSGTDIYKDYMASDDDSYEADRELWRKLYKTYIFNNDSLDQVLEDQSLYWNDDKEIVDTFVLKTIKRFDEKKGANQELLPEFKDDEDQEFARRLFRRTILNSDYYRHLISENTKNWDLDRIAFMDIIIMQTALAEILSFPNIPVSVSLNEYVEIAKLYSTSKSGSFINGTLDGIVNQLKKEGKLTKN